MITIVVPIYNAQKTLNRCIDSILSQSFKVFELLLVDDGSTDSSGIICEQYSNFDSRVRVIHQMNAGASAARNRGIYDSEGEYITFIDCDDYVSAYYLSDFDFENNLDFQIQGLTLTYPDSSFNKSIVPMSSRLCDVVDIIEECELNSLIRGPVGKLFKRDILNRYNIRFPIELSYGEDAIFVKKYLLHCNDKCRFVAKSNYYYTHESSDSLTSRFHSGHELFKTSLDEYHVFNQLLDRFPNISKKVISHFKWLKAIDTYQAIHNVIIDDGLTFKQKKSFINSLDKSFMTFIKDAKNLPIKFELLDVCYNYLPPSSYLHFLNVLYK